MGIRLYLPQCRRARLVLAAGLMAGLAACGPASDSLQIRLPDTLPLSGQPQPEAITHTVKTGESLYLIARTRGVPLRELITLNGLQPPYQLSAGQVLQLPVPRGYTVQKGDSLYAVSRKFNVAMNELARMNGLSAPYVIRIGQRLSLPGSLTATPAETGVEAPAPAQEAPAAAPPSPVTTVPAAGVPGASEPPAIAPPPVAPPAGGTERAPAAGATPAAPVTHTAPAPQARPGPVPAPPARAGKKFLWPVRGKIISTFGPKDKGLRNDGVNIAAPRGTAVRAAENGVVAHSGAELQEYGNLILIRHADGYLTAYAHNAALLVRRGDSVKRGQVIARVGSSGNVDRPQLHFQIRRGKQILDPAQQLEP